MTSWYGVTSLKNTVMILPAARILTVTIWKHQKWICHRLLVGWLSSGKRSTRVYCTLLVPLGRTTLYHSSESTTWDMQSPKYVFLSASTWSWKAPVSFIKSVPSVHPSVYLHVSAQFQPGEYSWNLIFGTFIEIFQENSNLTTIGQKYRALYAKTWAHLIVAGDISFP